MQLRPITAVAVAIILLVTGCSLGDDEGEEATETTETTETTEPTMFAEVVNAGADFGHCYFRQGELLLRENADGDPIDDEAIAVINDALENEPSLEAHIELGEPSDTVFGVRRYVLPEDEPTAHTGTQPSTGGGAQPGDEEGGGGGVVAVLDTGFDSADWPFGLTPEWFGPGTEEEVDVGPVAGHGTFIAGILARFSGADVVVTRPDRIFYSAPDQDDNVFPATDDWSVATAIERDLLGQQIDVLNLSLGTYACGDVLSHMTPVEGEVDDDISDGESRVREPITTRAALLALRTSNPGMVVTAAAGNDNHGPEEAGFYPAAWAVDSDFLLPELGVGTVIGVGADPLYSNKGDWVVATATGTLVSHRSVQDDLRKMAAGWYEWSGTSFAAPCLATAIVNGIGAGPTGAPSDSAAEAWLRLSDGQSDFTCS